MLRRHFFGKIGAGLGTIVPFGLLTKVGLASQDKVSDSRIFWATKQIEYPTIRSDFGLGKYVSHDASMPDIQTLTAEEELSEIEAAQKLGRRDLEAIGHYHVALRLKPDIGHRLIKFPTESVFTITYEHGKERYHGFNPLNNLVAWLNTSSITQILAHKVYIDIEGLDGISNNTYVRLHAFKFPNDKTTCIFKLVSASCLDYDN
jgi:hypothetical protein